MFVIIYFSFFQCIISPVGTIYRFPSWWVPVRIQNWNWCLSSVSENVKLNIHHGIILKKTWWRQSARVICCLLCCHSWDFQFCVPSKCDIFKVNISRNPFWIELYVSLFFLSKEIFLVAYVVCLVIVWCRKSYLTHWGRLMQIRVSELT